MSAETNDLPNPNVAGRELAFETSLPIDPESLARHYEQNDVSTRAIARFGIAIAIAVVVACTVLYFVMRLWTTQPLTPRMQFEPALVTPAVVPGPGLDAAPERTLELVRQRDRVRLQEFGWVDRDAGVVRIPIDAAMQLLVEQGIDAREVETPTFGVNPAFRLDGSGGLYPGEWMSTSGMLSAEDEASND